MYFSLFMFQDKNRLLSLVINSVKQGPLIERALAVAEVFENEPKFK